MIILYGGSFNPPTLAHYEILKLLNKKYMPAHIILMPVGSRYPKPELAEANYRLAMLKLMSKHFDNVIVSDFEITKPFIGTIRALEYLEETYKEPVALAIGADNLISLPTWIEADNLIKKYQLIVFNRTHILSCEKVKEFEKDHHVELDVISYDYDISASKIRKNIKKYRKHLLPEVYQFIKENHLYKEEK